MHAGTLCGYGQAYSPEPPKNNAEKN